MTKQEYLAQSFTLQRLLQVKESRIKELRDMQDRVSQINTGVKVQSNSKNDSMADLVATILDLIAEYKQDCYRLLSIQQEIAAIVETVHRDEHRLILFERYVNLKRWEDIAADNDYSEKHVYKLHRAAIASLNWIPNNTSPCDKVLA